MNKKGISKKATLTRIQRYCAYQERCHQEVRTKLLQIGVAGDTLEEIMADLIADGFLNEERFARSYARGKFRNNKWGMKKIELHLKQKGVTANCIKSGLSEIDNDEYLETLTSLMREKWGRSEAKAEDISKISNHFIRKGYDRDLVYRVIRKVTGFTDE